MASQSAAALISQTPGADGRLEVDLVLSCGCRLLTTIDANRIVELDDGRRLAGGKYPCPNGHPVGFEAT